jgi:shikimate kinase
MAIGSKRQEKPIVLTGLMGAGKSTLGRRLARRLALPFVDTDREIEIAAGMTVAEIFERHGEAGFRDGERRVLARLVEGPPRVIATGGGAFMDDGTRALILARCIAIWLDVELDTLVDRVGRRGGRPLLEGKDARALLRDLADARNPIYAQAHLTVRGGAVPREAMVDRIVAALAARA